MKIPSAEGLEAARARLEPHVHRTPVLTSSTFDERTGARLFFKCENLQRAGAFKIRGALNVILSLSPEELERGVVTHSSGNHAQALALAARLRGARAVVVMPENAPRVKVAAVEGYGARVVFCEANIAARREAVDEILEREGMTFVHPYDDPRIVTGQATAALELFDEVPDLDRVVTPVGGGGLLGGTALAARYFSPRTAVIGAEPAGADDAARSKAAGHIIPSVDPKTLADGLLTSLGELTFALVDRHVERIVTVEDREIVAAMRLLWERMKLVVEPSGAVSTAVVLGDELDVEGQRVGIVISGGNVDLDRLPWQEPEA